MWCARRRFAPFSIASEAFYLQWTAVDNGEQQAFEREIQVLFL